MTRSSLGAESSGELASRTIGRTPRPCFPVDSAISCSIQLPNPETSSLVETIPNLSLKPWLDAVAAIAAPSTSAGLCASSLDNASAAKIASCRIGSMSTPARTEGTTPNAVRAENLPPTFGLARNTR